MSTKPDPASATVVTEPSLERRLNFEGAVNFRDIGGYAASPGRRMRWQRIYRADNLGGLTEPDLLRFTALGLRTLIDFRLPSERGQQPDRLPPGSGLEIVEIGFIPEGTIDMLRGIAKGTLGIEQVEARVIDQYRRFVTEHTAEYTRALHFALDERKLPLLFHCTSGKDRTGFAIAALLMAVGTPRETILADYVLTNEFRRDIGHLFSAATPGAVADLLMSAQAKYLEAAFDQIDETYGSVGAYLERGLGLDDEKRRQLVRNLTEPEAAQPAD
jgi:protein-tyrosine phosphatase